MTVRVEIDPNVRVRGNQTFAGFEDFDGMVAAGDRVEVYESESGLHGVGTVSEIDEGKWLVFLIVEWSALTTA